MKQKTTCPRCGNPKASPNARGPNVIHCKPCGGLVPLADRDQIDETLVSHDPVRNALERESGIEDVGRVVTPTRTLYGGL